MLVILMCSACLHCHPLPPVAPAVVSTATVPIPPPTSVFAILAQVETHTNLVPSFLDVKILLAVLGQIVWKVQQVLNVFVQWDSTEIHTFLVKMSMNAYKEILVGQVPVASMLLAVINVCVLQAALETQFTLVNHPSNLAIK